MKRDILKNPLTLLAGAAAGIAAGVYNGRISSLTGLRDFAVFIAAPGRFYLFFLQMTLIPLIITALASSLGKLTRGKNGAAFLGKIAAILVLCALAAAALGCITGVLGRPGAGLNGAEYSALSRIVIENSNDLEISLSGHIPAAAGGFADFFRDMIPSNIFQALASGGVTACIFFAIVLGLAAGFLGDESAALLLNMLSAVFEAFQKLAEGALYLLPFALVCLLAEQAAALGPQIIAAMSGFIILYAAGTLVILIVSAVILWRRSGIANPFRVLSVLSGPALLSFAARGSLAALPSAAACLDNTMKFDSAQVNLALPLGMTLGRFGTVSYFTLAAFFVIQFYGASPEPVQYAAVFFCILAAGTASAGTTGIAALSLLGAALSPLGLPLEAVLLVFIAIDPAIEPLRTFQTLCVNMAAVSLAAKRKDEQQVPEEPPPELEEDPRKKQFVVYIQTVQEKQPILFREKKKILGLEISILEEMAKRLGREIVIKDTVAMGYEEGAAIKKDADIIAGMIKKSEEAPMGYTATRKWATITEKNIKTQICFHLPEESPDIMTIDRIIKDLVAEDFIAKRV